MDFNNDSGLLQNVSEITPTATGVISVASAGAIVLPTGPTASRPSTPAIGAFRYNSDINESEYWNGTAWINRSSGSIVSFILSTWSDNGDGLFYSDAVHNLSSNILSVTLWDASTNKVIHADSITAISTSTVRVTVSSSIANIRCVIIGAGLYTGYQAASTILRTLTYYANSLDSPNNVDWAVNALAPSVPDPANNAITVRRFSNTIEQGVGFFLTVPAGATAITFRFKGRAQSAPTFTSVVQPKLYYRAIPNNAAVGMWSTAYALSSITIPTNTYTQYSAQTFSLSNTNMTAGGMYQCEITRSTTVSSGTNLASNWLLSEVTIEFT